MEPKTKHRNRNKKIDSKDRYHYAYIIKGGNIVRFNGDPEIKKEFDIHHYGKAGILYYRK